MSYEKMMKWNEKHPKGISYKKGWVGFDTSTPGRFRASIAFLEEDYWPYVEQCKKAGIEPATSEQYYKERVKYDSLLKNSCKKNTTFV